jgi:hypothetical protein
MIAADAAGNRHGVERLGATKRSHAMKLKIKSSEIVPLAEIKLQQRGYINFNVRLLSAHPLLLEARPEIGPAILKEPIPVEQVAREIAHEFEIVD